MVQAASATRFDLWMLLLTVGTFAGAYPLMYFAQEYISLEVAVVVAAAIAIVDHRAARRDADESATGRSAALSFPARRSWP